MVRSPEPLVSVLYEALMASSLALTVTCPPVMSIEVLLSMPSPPAPVVVTLITALSLIVMVPSTLIPLGDDL